ncbi:protein HGH1 homolog, partial [Egretta garzetta]|uniref:protein HGH1 homolog n=1 Tax=Egretta garzetta TaxID=188379 RepID=UPI00163CC5B6
AVWALSCWPGSAHHRGPGWAFCPVCYGSSDPRLSPEDHEWLLSEEVDILPFLLLPLAGPEEFPEDEMERLPVDLQYLPQDKQREEEPDIRKMLLEAIMLLTATKAGRHVVREKGTYLILRELHRWEREPEVLAACEKLIQVLIGDEPGPGMENLLEVSVPEEVEEQLRRLDREEEDRWRREREEEEEEEEEQHEAQGSQKDAEGSRTPGCAPSGSDLYRDALGDRWKRSACCLPASRKQSSGRRLPACKELVFHHPHGCRRASPPPRCAQRWLSDPDQNLSLLPASKGSV